MIIDGVTWAAAYCFEMPCFTPTAAGLVFGFASRACCRSGFGAICIVWTTSCAARVVVVASVVCPGPNDTVVAAHKAKVLDVVLRVVVVAMALMLVLVVFDVEVSASVVAIVTVFVIVVVGAAVVLTEVLKELEMLKLLELLELFELLVLLKLLVLL